MPSTRLFIAIETPDEIKDRISGLQTVFKESRADVRWEPATKFHVTLKFLGETSGGLLPEIVSILRDVCLNQVTLHIRLAGVGFFPNRKEPRTIWIGAHDTSGTLGPLQQSIDAGMAGLGFQQADKEFHPHVTIGRFKSSRNLSPLLAIIESTTFESQPEQVSHVHLFKSELRPEGSIYTIVNSFPLQSKQL